MRKEPFSLKKEGKLIIPNGRVGEFNLKLDYLWLPEESTYTSIKDEREIEKVEISFNFKGHDITCQLWQVGDLKFATKESADYTKSLGLKHYIVGKFDRTKTAIVPITEDEFNAIQKWAKDNSQRRLTNKEDKEEAVDYSEQIAKAKETGMKVVINKGVRNSNNPYSDTEIVTHYIDGEGNITVNVVPMD